MYKFVFLYVEGSQLGKIFLVLSPIYIRYRVKHDKLCQHGTYIDMGIMAIKKYSRFLIYFYFGQLLMIFVKGLMKGIFLLLGKLYSGRLSFLWFLFLIFSGVLYLLCGFHYSCYSLNYFCMFLLYSSYLPTPPLGQDMTQGQFLSGV